MKASSPRRRQQLLREFFACALALAFIKAAHPTPSARPSPQPKSPEGARPSGIFT